MARVGKLTGEAEIKHIAASAGAGESSHRKVRLQFKQTRINTREFKSKLTVTQIHIYTNRQVSGQLTGLMSRCRKPTEWMLSMASKICLPSLKVVETEKVPRVMVLRKSARFLPLTQEISVQRVTITTQQQTKYFTNTDW